MDVWKRTVLLVAVLLGFVLAPAARAWTWPVDGAVLQPFVFDRSHPYAAGQHRGVDVGGAAGATVRAPAAGPVTFAGSVPGSGMSLTIATDGGLDVTLTHLGSLVVSRGAVVGEGDTVGTVGPSGDAEQAQPYVHLGIRTASDDQGYLDPLGFLPPRSAAPPAPTPSPAPTAPAPPAPAPPAPAPPAAAPAPPAVAAPAPAPAAVAPSPSPASPPGAAEAEPAAAQPSAGAGTGAVRGGLTVRARPKRSTPNARARTVAPARPVAGPTAAGAGP